MEDAETDTTISCIFCGAGSIPSNMASGFCDLCHKEFGAGKEVDTTGKTIRVITKTGLSFTAIVDNYCYNVINTMQIEDRAKETVANAR